MHLFCYLERLNGYYIVNFTIGIIRAKPKIGIKIGMANLVDNMKCLLFLRRMVGA